MYVLLEYGAVKALEVSLFIVEKGSGLIWNGISYLIWGKQETPEEKHQRLVQQKLALLEEMEKENQHQLQDLKNELGCKMLEMEKELERMRQYNRLHPHYTISNEEK